MIIKWIGHSCFKIEEDDYSVVLDPYADGMIPGLLPVREEANMVVASHQHDDHNAVNNISIINYGEAGKIWTETIQTFHDHEKGSKRGLNDITILHTENERIAHLGDLGCELEDDQKERLKGLDALLIPIGGFYTIDSDEAHKLVEEINPGIVIPMHFRSEGFGFDVISTKDRFIELEGEVTQLEECLLDTKDRFETRVVFLRPEKERK